MIELLLLGILIMQILTFHYNTATSGRYMKYYDILVHRFPKYSRQKTVILGKKAISKGKETYYKARHKEA